MHGYDVGDKVVCKPCGKIPPGLAEGEEYWVIDVKLDGHVRFVKVVPLWYLPDFSLLGKGPRPLAHLVTGWWHVSKFRPSVKADISCIEIDM